MGVVLPWRLVRHNLVPSVDDFGGVAHDILQIVADDRKAFKAAAFVGSLSRGDLHTRSDLDLILVGYPASFDRAEAQVRRFQALAASRGVPLDVALWSSLDARLGKHDYGPSYLETFPRIPPQFAVGPPLAECFRVPTGSVQGEMLAKLYHKLHSTRTRAGIFQARHADDPERVERWLDSSWLRVVRPMRVHITIGRRLLWWLNGELPDDGKAEVIDQFLAEKGFEPFHADYRELLRLDQDYNVLLGRAVAGRVRRGSYLRQVTHLLKQNFTASLRLLTGAISLVRSNDQNLTAAA